MIVEGKQILLRQGDGLVDTGGQLRLDFDATDDASSESETLTAMEANEGPTVLPTEPAAVSATPSDLVEQAADYEDRGELKLAAELYRAALAAGGPKAEICFLLAEVLYRMGDVAGARERYYVAVELDEDLIEARNNLGCVLMEIGETELAMAAFEGALSHHEEYADAHYHLGEALDQLGRTAEAAPHWRSFLKLAPDSPWADKARMRVGDDGPSS